jgi:hypothetical protein
MTFRFINFLWPLLALAGIPLIVHLFARTKPPAIQFSSIEFLRKVVRNTMRVRKPRDIFLLLLRTLAILALILMVMRPLIFTDGRWIAPGAQRHVVLIVDRSASMGYNEAGRTRFAAACAEASAILRGLSADDTANIVWLDANPQAIFPDMGINTELLRESLRKARVSSQAASVENAIRLAIRLLQKPEGHKEIHVISDFQRSNWRNCNPELPGDIAFYAIPIAEKRAANIAISDLFTTPATGLPGENMVAIAQVANYSDAPQHSVIFLDFAETSRKLDIVIAPWKTKSFMFNINPASVGDNLITASLDAPEDNFATDNLRRHILPVTPHITVAVPDKTDTSAFNAALHCLNWCRTIPLSEADSAAAPPDVVIMHQVPSDNPLFKKYLKNGALIIWTPPDNCKLSNITGFYTSGNQQITPESNANPFGLKVADANAPSLAIFKDGRYGDPAAASVNHRLNLPPSEHAAAIISYEDGTPAICRSKTYPNLILWNLPLDHKSSDFATQITFLPFLAELILHSSRKNSSALNGRYFISGNRIQRSFPDNNDSDSISVTDDNNQSIQLQSKTIHSGLTTYSTTTIPPIGNYTWHDTKQKLGLSIVNFPPIESDLRLLSKSELDNMGARRIANAQAILNQHNGREIWRILLLLAGIAIALETLSIYIFERKK